MAYKNLKEDLEKIKSYLISKGVSKNEIIASQISTETKYKHKKDDDGFETKEIESYCWNNIYRFSQMMCIR